MTVGKPGLFERAQKAEQRGNREVSHLWERYRGHRERTTGEIVKRAAAGGRLCLLGAGNANDLDLERIAAAYDEVHLVDIDPSALARATQRQSPETRAKLHSHGGVDLSGLYRQLETRTKTPPSSETLVATGSADLVAQLPGGFDVVTSCCILSQMSWALGELMEDGPLPKPILEQALLTVHLRTMHNLLRPGGTALLVADLVSSASYPVDELDPDEDLTALVNRLATQRLAFAVCNPELIRQILRRDPELAAGFGPARMGAPWLWTGSKELTYLVYPLTLVRTD